MRQAIAKAIFWTTLGVTVVALGAMWWVKAQPPAPDAPYNLDAFARLAVSSEGRVKPIDSVARDALDTFRGRQTALTPADEKKPAIQWYIDTITQRNDAAKDKVFRIDHPQVLSALGLSDTGDKYFSYSQLEPSRQQLRRLGRSASQVDQSERNSFQQSALELAVHVQQYERLRGLFEPYVIPPTEPGGDWQHLRQASQRRSPHAGAGGGVRRAQQGAQAGSGSRQAVEAWGTMVMAYRNENAGRFNSAIASYTGYLNTLIPGQMTRASLEVLTLNRFGPFYVGSILCIAAFLLGCLSWLFWMQPLRSAALALVLIVLALVTLGIIARIYIQMRPPVTNLYSSALFVGWGLLLLGALLDAIFKNSVGLVAAAAGGFTTLVLAQNLATGDTMEMQQAVLDTNFWLATHVTTVTLGYVATFAAGLLGILFIGLGVVASGMSDASRAALAGSGRTLARMIYGVICFALLLSFVGTVLGGLWADYSWGRFWGWDPKENGAAMIVLMNALILHARWGAMIKERGLAVLAVCGNIITAWSWFGTNLLGVGLHSYGFMDSGVFWLGLFVLSQLAIIAVGLMPLEIWHGSELMMSPRRVQQQRKRQREPSVDLPAGGAAPGGA